MLKFTRLNPKTLVLVNKETKEVFGVISKTKLGYEALFVFGSVFSSIQTSLQSEAKTWLHASAVTFTTGGKQLTLSLDDKKCINIQDKNDCYIGSVFKHNVPVGGSFSADTKQGGLPIQKDSNNVKDLIEWVITTYNEDIRRLFLKAQRDGVCGVFDSVDDYDVAKEAIVDYLTSNNVETFEVIYNDHDLLVVKEGGSLSFYVNNHKEPEDKFIDALGFVNESHEVGDSVERYDWKDTKTVTSITIKGVVPNQPSEEIKEYLEYTINAFDITATVKDVFSGHYEFAVSIHDMYKVGEMICIFEAAFNEPN